MMEPGLFFVTGYQYWLEQAQAVGCTDTPHTLRTSSLPFSRSWEPVRVSDSTCSLPAAEKAQGANPICRSLCVSASLGVGPNNCGGWPQCGSESDKLVLGVTRAVEAKIYVNSRPSVVQPLVRGFWRFLWWNQCGYVHDHTVADTRAPHRYAEFFENLSTDRSGRL